MKQYPPYEFRFFTDCGHGWLEVPLELLFGSNRAHLISAFSYMRNGYAYLEEDIDAGLFLGYLSNDEYTLEHINIDGMAPMRNYDKFFYPNGISDLRQA